MVARLPTEEQIRWREKRVNELKDEREHYVKIRELCRMAEDLEKRGVPVFCVGFVEAGERREKKLRDLCSQPMIKSYDEEIESIGKTIIKFNEEIWEIKKERS